MSASSVSLPRLAVLLGLALALRVAAAWGVQSWVERTPGRLCLIAGDAEGYWELGRRLARGEEYAVHEPPRRVLRMPGFPLLLAAGFRLAGESALTIRCLLAGVGTLACYLVYQLAARLFDQTVAWRACLIAALLPTFVASSVLLLSETLFAAALLGSLLAMAALAGERGRGDVSNRAQRWGRPIIAGLLCGVATLVRPTWLLAGPAFVGAWLFASADRRRDGVRGLVLLGALVAALTPWTIRNARVTGHFVPTTLWVGASLYDGLRPGATGASDMSFVERDGVYRRLSEYDADRHYRTLALQFAAENPLVALHLAGVKLWRFWSPIPNTDQFSHWGLRMVAALASGPLLALAAMGAWRSRRTPWNWLIPAAPVLYFSLIHLVFVGSLRYRLPAEYPLAVLAAVGCGFFLRRSAPKAAAALAVPTP